VIGSIANGMFLIDASTELRLLVQGGVLVLAVVADALSLGLQQCPSARPSSVVSAENYIQQCV
jgi:ribose/xylose/arabinose/galactoside ABC-type transport system permease subunit